MTNRQFSHADHRPGTHRHPLRFLAHDIDVPENIGSLFRIADALGVEMIHLSGSSPVPPDNKIRKTSRATEKYVPFDHTADPMEVVAQLKREGYTLISLEITSTSTDLRELSLAGDEKVCLIVGAENTGVCQDLLDVSDKTVHIAMLGQNSSMNVASATAIATFEITGRFLHGQATDPRRDIHPRD